MPPYIYASGLVRIFRSEDIETFALQGLDLSVNKGEIVALVGPSGAGKSTFLNLLAALDKPDAGSLMVNELNLVDATESIRAHYRQQHIGFLWQQTTRNIIPGLTARENIMLPALLAGRPYADTMAGADELLSAVDMLAFADYDPMRMSGGQQQRIALATALACKPAILLADEPTGEVDWQTAERILALLHSLRTRYNLTIVMVTHDQRVADSADRTVSIRDGRTSSEIGQDDIETVVIDAVGRLQIPVEVRQRLQVGRRATVTVVDGVIHITPITEESQ